MPSSSDRQVWVGEVVGVFGVKGWIRLRSFTEPEANLLRYLPWQLVQGASKTEYKLAAGRPHRKGLIAKLEGIEDRDSAAVLVGAAVWVDRKTLGDAEPGEYFWSDLEGMVVKTLAGLVLGRVDSLLETGANDVLVVMGDRRRLIPFVVDQVVRSVDLEQRTILVDWDPEF